MEPTSSGPTLPPSGVVKIVVEGQEFVVADSSITQFAPGMMQRSEDDSYTFPSDWNVGSTQFSTLVDLLHCTK